MATRYKGETDVINLDKLAKRKDTDFSLKFGGAELIIQYRAENALREWHPFIDIVVAPGDEPMTVDLCDEEGRPIRV